MAELNGTSEQAAEDGAQPEQLAQAPEPGCASVVANQIELLAGRNNRISSTIDILNHDDEQVDQLDDRARLQADAEANKVQRISQTNPRNTIEGDADPRNLEVVPAQRPHGVAVTESKGLSTLRAQIQYSLKKNNFLDSQSNRTFKGHKNGGNASSPSLQQKADESGCLNEGEPLTERFIKEDNINSKCNSVRRQAYGNEGLHAGGPLPEELASISPQTKRKSPPIASSRQRERRFGNRDTSSNQRQMLVIDLQDTARYSFTGKMVTG